MLLGSVIFALIGAAAMIYLNGDGLTSRSKYHTDLTQSPHWVAYRSDAFADDDLLVEYSTYNETALQNAIYRVGTRFIDLVLLNKIVGIAIFGLTAALFFALVSSMSGLRIGLLAALFFILFPRSTYEIAGGFSKAWAIGLVLVAVWILETRKWPLLVWVMPLAAVAYPVSPVLIGAIVSVGLLLELPRGLPAALRGLTQLAIGSALALVPLLYKYFTPPARIGEMISTEEMKAMWKSGESLSATRALWEELLGYLEHPFFVYGGVVLLMFLWRRGLVWRRSWSALIVSSAIAYQVSDLVVPRLYLPDRYIRYSMAVLLVLWFAHNWARVLEAITHRWAQRAAVAGIVALAATFLSGTFKPCDGDPDLGLWEDQGAIASVSQVIAAQPTPVLVAGHPYYTADVMVQARRPVLVINRLFHSWFSGYGDAIDTRVRDTFRALYATDVRTVNEFAERYGVTHMIVGREEYKPRRRQTGKIYRIQYIDLVAELARDHDDFVLDSPPADAVVFEDANFRLIRLPLDEPDRAAGADGRPQEAAESSTRALPE